MNYILNDLQSASQYIPIGLIAALISISIRICWLYIHRLKINKNKLIVEYAFFTYAIAVLFISLLSREPGSRADLALVPLSTWGTTARDHAYVVENILMFIPLGILLPSLWSKANKLRFCFLIALLSSLAIELTQVFAQRGYGQTDDVLTNVLGAVFGFGIWKIVCFFFERKNIL